MITTIHGDMDESELEKREIVTDNDNEYAVATEYWQLVHRSVHVHLKKAGVVGTLLAGSIA